MKVIPHLTVFVVIVASLIGCSKTPTEQLKKALGAVEYSRLINLRQDEFYQATYGYRQYAQNYNVVKLLIPEYIQVNKLTSFDARSLNYALGEIHALENNYPEAIASFRKSLPPGALEWRKHYVYGTIAFLEKDRAGLNQAIEGLKSQRKPGQLSILQRFASNIDRSYKELTTSN